MTRVSRPDFDPRLGTVLVGKYRLDRVIGSGGMAVVYKATHRNHAEFAVKMLYPELSVIEDIRARFLREGYAANAVKHPGAVRVVDDEVAEDGAAFLVMELLEGVPCDELWGSVGHRVSVEVASAITIQLLDVLAAAHENGIIHRDIKPANLFLTRSGVVKVLDFGIAKAREVVAGARATGSGITLGTPAFMAPEHARGRAREIDGRTDLWAAAATFFAMVSGELVHAAETKNEFVIAAGTRPARSLATTAAAVSAAFGAVIDRGLAFEKGDRWPSAAAMRDALLRAHRDAFGGEEGKALERIVAAAVKRHVPLPEAERVMVSPVAETRTSVPPAARAPTARLSTSAGTATTGDRESVRLAGPTWALGALAAVVVAALGGTAWLGTQQRGRDGADARTRSASGPVGRDAETVAIARAESGESADRKTQNRAAMEEPRPSVATASSAANDPLAPVSPGPKSHPKPWPPPRQVAAAARDAGAPAASCNPPWFLDGAGHKQYKPDCI